MRLVETVTVTPFRPWMAYFGARPGTEIDFQAQAAVAAVEAASGFALKCLADSSCFWALSCSPCSW
jgi:hypothetical protein